METKLAILKRRTVGTGRSLVFKFLSPDCSVTFMPRYFFHIRRHDRLGVDDEGMNLTNVAAARREALISAREIMADRLKRGTPLNGDQFEITDKAGSIVAIVKFKDTMP